MIINVALIEPSIAISSIVKNVCKLQDFRITHLVNFSNLKYSYKISDFSVLIFNISLIDEIFPKFLLRDSDFIDIPPSLCITNKTDCGTFTAAIDRGVDECISFPFNKEIFIHKIISLSRRYKKLRGDCYKVGDFRIVRDADELFYKTNRVNLSKKEYLILSLLLENPNRTITKEEIMRRVWLDGKIPTTNAIDAHISNIRKKLRLRRNQTIHTMHGIGYKAKIETNKILEELA